jgi:hypothetical protein
MGSGNSSCALETSNLFPRDLAWTLCAGKLSWPAWICDPTLFWDVKACWIQSLSLRNSQQSMGWL